MKKIITVQHTQSIHHTNGMVGSWTDWDLTDLGKEQAQKIGEKLAAEINGDKYIIYSSDLLRAKNTALIIGKSIGLEPLFKTVLRERNLGSAVGKSVQWLRQNMVCTEKTVDDKMFSDAESRRDVWKRIQDFYTEIMNSEHENIIIVSHGDTLSIFNMMFLEKEIEALNKSELFGLAGGVTFMTVREDGKHMIRRLSDMSYLI